MLSSYIHLNGILNIASIHQDIENTIEIPPSSSSSSSSMCPMCLLSFYSCPQEYCPLAIFVCQLGHSSSMDLYGFYIMVDLQSSYYTVQFQYSNNSSAEQFNTLSFLYKCLFHTHTYEQQRNIIIDWHHNVCTF